MGTGSSAAAAAALLEVLPEYRGDSIVPARIRVRASLATGAGKPFEDVIAVW